MLTGDENIVDVDFAVFWRISDAPKFLFNIEDPDMTVKAVAESAMREIVGHSDIEPLLTEARAEDRGRGAGAHAEDARLLWRRRPGRPRFNSRRSTRRAQVIDAFRDVQAARADQERLQNEARSLCQPHHS